MLFKFAADAVAVIHLLFVAFAVLGGLLALRWHWVAWLHLPALAWGATVEFTGWICPLTPLENSLRSAGGVAAQWHRVWRDIDRPGLDRPRADCRRRAMVEPRSLSRAFA